MHRGEEFLLAWRLPFRLPRNHTNLGLDDFADNRRIKE